tara:strand:- start:742 stop:1092 length:351 start_codon:yes stop_codon:yes gene_type:complete
MKLNTLRGTLLDHLGRAQVDNLLQLALGLAQYQVVISISLALQAQAPYRLRIGASLAHSLLHVLLVHEALLPAHVILWSSNSSSTSNFDQILDVLLVDLFYESPLAPRLSWYLRFY